MGGIAKVNGIDIWWEEYGEKSNPTVLLIMGANANCMQWPDALIEVLVANDLHVVRFDNRDVGKSTWFNKEPFISKVAKLLPLSISSKLVNYAFSTMTDDDGNFTAAEGSNAKSYIMEGVGHEIPEQLLPEITTEMVTLFKQSNDH